MTSIQFIMENINVFVLVFCRIGGMVFFNPLLSRKNIPAQFKIALVVGTSALVAPQFATAAMNEVGDFVFMWTMVQELLIGFACGYVFQLYYYLLFAAGDIIDMGFGLSMAKAFDPGTNIQISMTGNILQMLFVLYVFLTNSHLVLIKLIVSSYDVVGIGASTFGENIANFMMTLFSSAFLLVMQLALPFLVATFVMELAMGILMKLVPQINVFSIHFQIKIIMGIFLLFLFADPVSTFIRGYVNTMFLNIQDVFVAVS